MMDLTPPRGRRTFVDRLMRVVAWMCAGIALVPLVWILVTVIGRGASLLFTAEPDYTKVCAVPAAAPNPADVPFKRVANSECATPGHATWRYVVGGSYPAVGQFLTQASQSTATDPAILRGDKLVYGLPNSDSAGTIRTPSLAWWTTDNTLTPDQNPGGGALHAIVGTLWLGFICTVIAVPFGILGAYYLVEYARGTRAATVVSFMVDILTGVPSIVAALFIYAVAITMLHGQPSTIAASFALVLLMLPTVLRSTEEMLKLVPDTLREAAYALGVPKWKTILRVVTPTAFTGIATGVVLGVARVMGETAPLLILLNYSRTLTLNPLSNTMGSLPTMIANAASLPSDYPGAQRGWGAALTLILIVMGLNLIARAIGRRARTPK